PTLSKAILPETSKKQTDKQSDKSNSASAAATATLPTEQVANKTKQEPHEAPTDTNKPNAAGVYWLIIIVLVLIAGTATFLLKDYWVATPEIAKSSIQDTLPKLDSITQTTLSPETTVIPTAQTIEPTNQQESIATEEVIPQTKPRKIFHLVCTVPAEEAESRKLDWERKGFATVLILPGPNPRQMRISVFQTTSNFEAMRKQREYKELWILAKEE
ncbi:MAG: hypothetical protein NZ108_06280, partial [Bacteroidia bacterium]|nr:hypothetical protein [Bacteroidia bacterium]